ncbi:MAG: DNA repair and recombination protein RadB [Candidatus Aenigmarchaeota archaeon]|nr:DNA repair and recombination protein RadB [Candidatus Aenigmarchaeota archaeon]
MQKLSLPEPLHSLLGGLEANAITNFYGAPGTGKTNICMLAMLECLKDGNSDVVFIDTEGGFSPDRFSQLSQNNGSLLERIILLEPKTFAEQGKIIRQLKELKAEMVIVDSAVALYRLEYADPTVEHIEANRELSRQLSILSTISRERGIPVLITAHTFKRWETGENEILGGEIIKYWSKAIIFLEKTGKASERKATIVKHRSLEEGRGAKFVLVNDGIRPAGFKLF